MNFSDLRSANVARDREWVSPGSGAKLSLSFRGNELAGEVGEACNVIKKLEREQLGLVGSRATLDDLADELSDCIICIDLIAMDLGLDLAAAVARKFNATSEKRGLATRLEPSTALRDIAAERLRQRDVEGWAPEHDDAHDKGELAKAAAAYATVAAMSDGLRDCVSGSYSIENDSTLRHLWPWARSDWKPKTRRHDLVRAGALILAEIERLDRAAARAAALPASEERR